MFQTRAAPDKTLPTKNASRIGAGILLSTQSTLEPVEEQKGQSQGSVPFEENGVRSSVHFKLGGNGASRLLAREVLTVAFCTQWESHAFFVLAP